LAQLLPDQDFFLVANYYNLLLLTLDELREHQSRQDPRVDDFSRVDAMKKDALTKAHIDSVSQASKDASHYALAKYRVPDPVGILMGLGQPTETTGGPQEGVSWWRRLFGG
jgi:hypothetical protein